MEHDKKKGGEPYLRFMAMIATSTVALFVLMYVNTYNIDHVFWSETRFRMAFVMGACMMVIMLLFMWGVYKRGGAGAIKLNGKLIPLPHVAPGRYAQGGLAVILNPIDEEGDAGLQAMEMILAIPGSEDELGYSGFVQCYDGDEV